MPNSLKQNCFSLVLGLFFAIPSDCKAVTEQDIIEYVHRKACVEGAIVGSITGLITALVIVKAIAYIQAYQSVSKCVTTNTETSHETV